MQWTDLLMSVMTGVISSSIFILILYKLRPKLDISGFIAEYDGENNREEYAVKIINRSRFSAMDVKIVFDLVTPSSVPGGHVHTAKKIKLISDNFILVNGFRNSDKEANYAFRIRTDEDIRSLWQTESQYLRITIVGRHSLSGFYGVFQKEYFTKGDIKSGLHQFGDSLEVRSIT